MRSVLRSWGRSRNSPSAQGAIISTASFAPTFLNSACLMGRDLKAAGGLDLGRGTAALRVASSLSVGVAEK